MIISTKYWVKVLNILKLLIWVYFCITYIFDSYYVISALFIIKIEI